MRTGRPRSRHPGQPPSVVRTLTPVVPASHRQLCESAASSTAPVVPGSRRQLCEFARLVTGPLLPMLTHASVVPVSTKLRGKALSGCEVTGGFGR